MLDKLEWPSLEARRDQCSLLLFHKIHSGAMSIEKKTSTCISENLSIYSQDIEQKRIYDERTEE